MRLEHGGAQGWGEDHRHKHGQGHGRNNGNGKLPVNDADRAAEKGHRDEHRGQHHGDAHQSADDLVHGFAGRLLGRKVLLAHDALDVFHHHNSVVDQKADGQNHGEHGQGVDRKTGRRQNPEGAQKHHRNRDGGNESCSEVLQKQIHDEKNQQDGFTQGLVHLVNGDAHKGRGVIRIHRFKAAWEKGGHLVDALFHVVGRIQGVGPGGHFDGQARGRLAVVAGAGGEALAVQIDAGHILEVDGRAVGIDAQNDVGELLGLFKPAGSIDGNGDLLARQGGQAADLAAGHLIVLGLHGIGHVRRRELVLLEFGRIAPYPHGVLSAEQVKVADPGHTADRILNVGRNIVADIRGGHAAVFGYESNDKQEVFSGFGHLDALALDRLRQQGHGQLQLILHLHLGDIHVGAGVKGQGDGGLARGVAGGVYIVEVVKTLHLLLNDLSHRVFNGFGRRAGIGRGDGDFRRGDGRVLGDGQGIHGQGAGHHDDDGDNPGEDWSVDEKAGHRALPPHCLPPAEPAARVPFPVALCLSPAAGALWVAFALRLFSPFAAP